MNREEELFQKRLKELAGMADRRNIVTFTDFLNLNELNIFHLTSGDLPYVNCRLFGGYENAERQIIAFIPDALSYDFRYPVSCIRICPQNMKYAQELSHRDFLGSLLSLGIERSTLGDILIDGKTAWVFCLERMQEFILNSLTKVKHTNVICEPVDYENVHYTPKYELIRGSVASVRLDSLLSIAFGASRSSLVGLIEGGKVFVNGKMVTSNGYKLKENDIVSVRGFGRFCYLGISSGTRKGRMWAELKKFV